MLALRTTIFLCLVCFSQTLSGQDIVKENLGPKINTQYDETKPIIAPDGKILYFARQSYPENIKGDKDLQDIYYCLHTDNEWSQAVNIGEPLNDKHPNGVSSVAPDGNSLLVINAYHSTGLTMGGASISKKQNNYWQKPVKINIQNFYNFSDYVDYYMSNDEKSLLMAVQREDSEGDQDIYVSHRIDEYNWSEPITLGEVINTPSAEFAPFLAADNKTLFFASQGHDGVGGSDIFYSKRLDNTWQNWSEPENIGPEVNTAGFEAYYTIPASGDFAYFVSDNNSISDSKDLFKITLPYQFRPEPVLMVKGNVFDNKTKAPLAASIIFVDLEAKDEAGFALSNFDDGSYKIILPRGTKYQFLAERPGYIGIVQYRDLTDITEYQELESNLGLVPIEKGQVATSHHIFFTENTREFMDDAYVELDRFTSIFKNNPGIKIEIGAHANTLQSATANLELSEKRALAIKQYFEQKGVNGLRLLTLPNGSVKPYDGPEVSLKRGTNVNDRVDFTIIQTDWSPPSINDADGDNVVDEIDECPDEKGSEATNGCPDNDKDGIINDKDDCPNVAGVEENNGCPELAEEVKKVLKEALEGIEFESGRDIIKPTSYAILDQVVEVMQTNADYKLKIAGHTDSMGKDETNLILSHKRAEAAKNYLVEKGVEEDRLDAVGYGETKPVASNDTAAGRRQNRRVEFTVIFE
ncbi:MAG: OmpA family protein [Fulvivirga sp.]